MNTASHTPTTERRARARGPHLCSCQECRRCRTACPTPQACELPDEDPPTAMELIGYALVLALFTCVILLAAYMGASV
ncbi:hypothetical protein [Acidovorax sp. Leaf78]|uniref:hypothetical protein n=1 Tax=Acidovorax sp. Leaf78 TaxID=1736237 RepID=UPI0006FA5C7D|nr:hypothetical protein [Acidovorax sp. Leaf78]KQO23475.1 hypothetical protein ASF16_04750 [Acidovorax sp. Leaf78]